MRCEDVIDDDGGDAHDLARPRGHHQHREHDQYHERSVTPHCLLGYVGCHKACESGSH